MIAFSANRDIEFRLGWVMTIPYNAGLCKNVKRRGCARMTQNDFNAKNSRYRLYK